MYYVIEHDKRPDGIVNTSETGRTTFASALSYYYERKSKMIMTNLYTSVALMCVDENLNVIEQCKLDTQYVAPEEPVAEE